MEVNNGLELVKNDILGIINGEHEGLSEDAQKKIKMAIVKNFFDCLNEKFEELSRKN